MVRRWLGRLAIALVILAIAGIALFRAVVGGPSAEDHRRIEIMRNEPIVNIRSSLLKPVGKQRVTVGENTLFGSGGGTVAVTYRSTADSGTIMHALRGVLARSGWRIITDDGLDHKESLSAIRSDLGFSRNVSISVHAEAEAPGRTAVLVIMETGAAR